MKISDNVREKLQQQYILDLIDQEKYQELYRKFHNRERSELTQFLLHCNIKPDDYMLYLPEGYLAFSGISSYDISNSITRICNYSFQKCMWLTSITIPDSVTSIGSGAFSRCTELTSVTIPDSVTSIGQHAFSDCCSLRSIMISTNVTSIERGTFWQCTSLTNVNIPNSVTSIGENAFVGCTSLTEVKIPDRVTSIGMCAFNGCGKIEIKYDGTVSEWKNLIGNNSRVFKNTTYTCNCSDGVVKKSR